MAFSAENLQWPKIRMDGWMDAVSGVNDGPGQSSRNFPDVIFLNMQGVYLNKILTNAYEKGNIMWAGKSEPHEFREKTFKKKRQCGVCKQNIESLGTFCRVCKTATHKKCESKGSTKSLTYTKPRSTLPRSLSVDRVMDRVMERHYDFDLTYITERIISVFFPPLLDEQRYRLNLKEVAAMLKSKHQDKYFLLNLSEKRHDITRINPKGNKGKTGVITAAYMHYSKISAGDLHGSTGRKLCVTIEPALLLKGDIMVKCYHRQLQATERDTVFRLQFHTCTIHGSQLWFGKGELDEACSDDRFPPDATVEFVFSSGPEKMKGREYQRNDPAVTVDYNTADQVVRWDSYDNLNLRHEDSLGDIAHTRGPLDGSLYAQVKKRRAACSSSFPSTNVSSGQISDERQDHSPLFNTDSRHSSAPPQCIDDSPIRPSPTQQEREELERLLGGIEGERTNRDLERETAILDDVDSLPPEKNVSLRLARSCSCRMGYRSQHCSKLHHLPNGYCVDHSAPSNIHTGVPVPNMLGLCQHHSGPMHQPLPPPDLLWDRQQGSQHYLHGPRHVCPYPSQDFCPHPHTLSPSGRLLCRIALGKRRTPSRKRLRRSRGSELPRRTELHWERKAGLRPGRELSLHWDRDREAELQWEREQEAEYWHRRTALSPYGPPDHEPAFTFDPLPQGHPALPEPSKSHSHAHLDIKYSSGSSSYQTSHQMCPCSSYQPSPSESRGYASGYQSDSTSPLPQSYSSCYSHTDPHLHYTTNTHSDGSRVPGENVGWRDHIIHCSLRRPHREAHGPCSTPSDMSGPPTPVHTSSPVHTHESPGLIGQHLEAQPSEISTDSTLYQQRTNQSFQQNMTNPGPEPERVESLSTEPPNSCTYISEKHCILSHSISPQNSIQCCPQNPAHCLLPQQNTTHSISLQKSPTNNPSPQPSPINHPFLQPSPTHHPSPQPSPTNHPFLQPSPTHHPSPQPSPTHHPSPQQSSQHNLSPHQSPTRHLSPHQSPTHHPSPHQSPTHHPCSQQSPTHCSTSHQNYSHSAPEIPPSTTNQQASSTHSMPASLPETNQQQSTCQPIKEARLPLSALQPVQNEAVLPTVSSQSLQQIHQIPILESVPAYSQSNGMPPASDPNFFSSSPLSPQPTLSSLNNSSSPELPVPGFATLGRKLMLDSGPTRSGDLDTSCSAIDAYSTSTSALPSTTAFDSIATHPPLPEKRRQGTLQGSANGRSGTLRASPGHFPSGQYHVTFSPMVGSVTVPGGEKKELAEGETSTRVSVKFVQDSSRFWYKPGISREQAIAALKEKEPGAFLVRDSNSFQGAYGLALKVALPPANISKAVGDPMEQLVRHFLIETGPRGVKIKGCQNEPHFGSLSALVYQHSITPISLPCALRIPDKDPTKESQEMQTVSNMSTAADLLKQGAACNVLYLNSVETESLTGPQAVAKATGVLMSLSPRPLATIVHFKVSTQGITLTDNQRRVFFRRHYPINSVTFSSIDPQDRRVFGFVAKKPGSTAENACHLFAELDPEQPATAIVNFINKVMLGPQQR
ncbi:Tensin-2 [Bagarius yarrelli]|uniref:Tensin-2 n=1 Tax=Bagarius yarrelli TaxID=175774 RepID=A0A556VAP3_BAGYA|nr:Tensin-2 [Bagarius yarrelli]